MLKLLDVKRSKAVILRYPYLPYLDEVLLTHTMPLSPRGVLEEKVGVLSTVQYGGR